MNLTKLLFVFDGNNINIWIAFAAGFLTFFASCLLPLVPSYLAYISGISYSEIKIAAGTRKRKVILNSIIFTLGFVLAFVFLGIIGHKLYSHLISYKKYFEFFAGLLFITLGLYNLEFFKLAKSYINKQKVLNVKSKYFDIGIKLQNILETQLRIDIRKFLTKWNIINSFIIGLGFGLAWTPCIGPVLGLILYWASEAATLSKGLYLLIFFGLGLGVPFILVGAGAEIILEKFSRFKNIQKIIGILTVLAGITILI